MPERSYRDCLHSLVRVGNQVDVDPVSDLLDILAKRGDGFEFRQVQFEVRPCRPTVPVAQFDPRSHPPSLSETQNSMYFRHLETVAFVHLEVAIMRNVLLLTEEVWNQFRRWHHGRPGSSKLTANGLSILSFTVGCSGAVG